MKLSYRWLTRHLPNVPAPSDLIPYLEQLGFEVASLDIWGEDYQTIELVEVLNRTPHPDSDHLSLVTVARGHHDATQIVTGASNGCVGDRLWYAPPGTKMPDGRILETKPLRGISSPGMLLSAAELTFMAPGDLWVWSGPEALGTSFLTVLGGADWIFELELTPNLATYAQSVAAIARQLGAILQLPGVNPPDEFVYGVDPLCQRQSGEDCPVYGLVEFGIARGTVSPIWMQALLRAIGNRIIHPAVDLTNFILWDVGQPLHAFDRDKVRLPLEVRRARDGEAFVTLDQKPLILSESDLVIADQNGPVALAGVMGGWGSHVDETTEGILLEAAHFNRQLVFDSMRHHQLFTDAALHFSRGTDPQEPKFSPTRVAELLAAAGCEPRLERSALLLVPQPLRTVQWHPDRIRSLLGVDWDDVGMKQALLALGFGIGDGNIAVPPNRHDITLVEDLAEEVARFYGIDAIPATLPKTHASPAQRDPKVAAREELRDLWVRAGFVEVVTRAFSSPEREGILGGQRPPSVVITNPIREDERQLRTWLLPGLLDVVASNRARQNQPLAIFEMGTVFTLTGSQVDEGQQLAAALTLEPIKGYPSYAEPSVLDLKGVVRWISQEFGWGIAFQLPTAFPGFMHPGRSVELTNATGRHLGYLGELRPKIAQSFHCKRLAVLWMEADPVKTGGRRVVKPSRFPDVERDLSLVIPDSVHYETVMAEVHSLQIPVLQRISLIDRFAGDFGIALTVRFVFQSYEETLTDNQVDSDMRRIVRSIEAMGVTIRQ